MLSTNRNRRTLLLRLALGMTGAVLFAATAHATPSEQEGKVIEKLIAQVAAARKTTFIRNGREVDAPAAAEHLRAKYRHFKDRISTASDFIRLAGTQSELSGMPYRVRLPDGKTLTSAEFLHDQLKSLQSTAAGNGATPAEK